MHLMTHADGRGLGTSKKTTTTHFMTSVHGQGLGTSKKKSLWPRRDLCVISLRHEVKITIQYFQPLKWNATGK